ncbi:hypothetical protein [Dulcicalothrix desertica]|nr:hypothetical protein [Dulcicalothrix desertica]
MKQIYYFQDEVGRNVPQNTKTWWAPSFQGVCPNKSQIILMVMSGATSSI